MDVCCRLPKWYLLKTKKKSKQTALQKTHDLFFLFLLIVDWGWFEEYLLYSLCSLLSLLFSSTFLLQVHLCIVYQYICIYSLILYSLSFSFAK